jgi:DNA-binding transcriptional ArsR family regulator
VPLTARGFLALREIRRRAPPTQRDLARRLHLEPSTLCELLARLRRAGLVERRGGAGARAGGSWRGPSPPALTARGAAALQHAERVVARLERDWGARCFAARHPAEDAGPCGGILGPSYGLRRWIAEGLDALAPSARRRRAPRPKR